MQQRVNLWAYNTEQNSMALRVPRIYGSLVRLILRQLNSIKIISNKVLLQTLNVQFKILTVYVVEERLPRRQIVVYLGM